MPDNIVGDIDTPTLALCQLPLQSQSHLHPAPLLDHATVSWQPTGCVQTGGRRSRTTTNTSVLVVDTLLRSSGSATGLTGLRELDSQRVLTAEIEAVGC